MSKHFKALDDSFDIENNSSIPIKNVDSKVIDPPVNINLSDAKKDYEYARGNLYSIVEKGQEAINGVLELAQETESARAYEVLGQLIKNVSDSAEKLLDIQKKIKDIEEEKIQKGPTNVTNALFVGSTAELSKLLKQQKDK